MVIAMIEEYLDSLEEEQTDLLSTFECNMLELDDKQFEKWVNFICFYRETEL